MKTNTESKYGIFFHANTNVDDRRYWVGTYTEDRSACEEKLETANGFGKEALKDAKRIWRKLNRKDNGHY